MAREAGPALPGRLEWLLVGAFSLVSIGAFTKAEINREALPPTATPAPTATPYIRNPQLDYQLNYQLHWIAPFDYTPQPTPTLVWPDRTPQAIIPTATRRECDDRGVGGNLHKGGCG